MDLQELEKLATWYIEHFSQLNQYYQQLIGPLQHNASQQNKQPFEPNMISLNDYLNTMNFEVLSLQQIKTLNKLGVAQFIGSEGAEFISRTIKTADFDPATGLSVITEAFAKLLNIKQQFESYLQALSQLDLRETDVEELSKQITIRIGFQNAASIDNVTKWKDSAAEWYDIIRGLALAMDEAPENTRVVSATKGSIILTLAGTYAVTMLLAKISTNVLGVAKDTLEIMHTIQDLRTKKILNDVIETELNRKMEKVKEDALESLIEEIRPLLPDENGEKITALKHSVKKLLDFNEKGGNVDFVGPNDGVADTEVEGGTASGIATLTAVRNAINDHQKLREQIKQLSHQSQV